MGRLSLYLNPPPEDIQAVAARGVDHVRRSIEAQPWGSGLIDVVAEDTPVGMTIVALIQPGYADPAHDWRARHGASYGPCRIVIRPEGRE
jgi:hypothetical protein